MNKQSLTWVIIVIVIAVAAGFFLWWLWSGSLGEDAPANQTVEDSESSGQSEEPMLGGDRDEHGCIPSAGYVWCEAKQKCLRPWEEDCASLEENDKEDDSSSSTDDNRILLTPENITQYCNPAVDLSACEAQEFNVDSPSTTVDYVDQERGIAFAVPYNPDWGSQDYRIEPYEEESDYLFFGPMTRFEGGGWARPFWMLGFTEAKSADDLIAEIKNSPDTMAASEPEKVDVNGLEVVRYVEMGLGEHYMMEVIGYDYNYRFVASDFTGEGTDMWGQMEKVVGTVEIL